jgi:hypothetical protein
MTKIYRVDPGPVVMAAFILHWGILLGFLLRFQGGPHLAYIDEFWAAGPSGMLALLAIFLVPPLPVLIIGLSIVRTFEVVLLRDGEIHLRSYWRRFKGPYSSLESVRPWKCLGFACVEFRFRGVKQRGFVSLTWKQWLKLKNELGV